MTEEFKKSILDFTEVLEKLNISDDYFITQVNDAVNLGMDHPNGKTYIEDIGDNLCRLVVEDGEGETGMTAFMERDALIYSIYAISMGSKEYSKQVTNVIANNLIREGNIVKAYAKTVNDFYYAIEGGK